VFDTRDWREKQAAEIKARDEASKAKKEEAIAKAEKAIDQFYEEYAQKKERNIRENKCVYFLYNVYNVVDRSFCPGNTRRSSLPISQTLSQRVQPGNVFASSLSLRIHKAKLLLGQAQARPI
jgi:hypothetical protein